MIRSKKNTPDDPSQAPPTMEEATKAALKESNLQKEKTLKNKKRRKNLIILGVVTLLGYGIYWLSMPLQGSMPFGICKVFLELNVRYPDTLRLSTVEEFKNSVRIWYAHIDSFGEYQLEPIQCYFKADEEVGFVLDRVTIRRREVDRQAVEDFNVILPVILANPPSLDLPWPLEDKLQDLQIDPNMFRIPIL